MQTFNIILNMAAIALGASYSVYAVARDHRSVTSWALALALLSAVFFLGFDFMASAYPGSFLYWKKCAIISESLMPGLWFLFSATYARKQESRFTAGRVSLLAASLVFPAAAVYLPLESFFFSPDFDVEKILFLGSAGFVFYVGVLFYMILAAINLEATLRTASGTAKWKIKFETIGAGALIAALIFYYSQGLLYRSINMEFLPLRSLAMIAAIGFMAYSSFMRGNGVKVYVSKDMAYRSVVLFIVSIYLIALGIIGEGMKHFGEPAKQHMIVLLAFLSVLALVIVLLSEKIKRKIKVFLHKNFYSNKYDYRSQWLKYTERISSSKSREEVLQAILSGFAETFGMKGAALLLREGDSYRAVSEFETYFSRFSIGTQSGIVDYLKRKDWVLNASEDTSSLPAEERECLQQNDIAFVVPLVIDADLAGLIVLKGPLNRSETCTYEDYDLMKTLSSQASSTVLNLRLIDELANARELETAGRISAFVVHDLKNHVSSLSMMVENADEHMDNPEFQKDMVGSLRSTVKKMNALISRLRNIKEKAALNLRSADLRAIAEDALGGVSGDVRLEGSSVLAEADPEEIQKVVLNIVLNAIEASPVRSTVLVEVGASDRAYISVRDGGCGMSAEFIETRLFKPFSTTKKKGLGIGLYQCKQVVEAHGGAIEVASQPGKGTVFTIKLPLAKRDDNVLNFQAS